MSTPKTPRHSESSWAKPVDRLEVSDLPAGAINLNVHGRQIAGPLNGFGQLWQKNYRVRLSGVAVEATEVIRVWKAQFSGFWPAGNRFYGKLGSITAGDVAVLNLAGPAHSSISTGIIVIYTDDESFSFMTPEGHIFAAMITFSASQTEAQGDSGEFETLVQIQALIRASDPIYEIGCRLGVVHQQEDLFWHGTLKNLATHFGVKTPAVEQQTTCVDSRIRWAEFKNIWYNAAVRTMLDAPVRTFRRLLNRA
jgi:hypothetical protein